MKTVRLLISGTVQGVWYRGWTRREAIQRGLHGWVRNRSDGRVEALLSGPSEQVDDLVKACQIGPPAASVSGIEVSSEQTPPPAGFTQQPDYTVD